MIRSIPILGQNGRELHVRFTARAFYLASSRYGLDVDGILDAIRSKGATLVQLAACGAEGHRMWSGAAGTPVTVESVLDFLDQGEVPLNDAAAVIDRAVAVGWTGQEPEAAPKDLAPRTAPAEG